MGDVCVMSNQLRIELVTIASTILPPQHMLSHPEALNHPLRNIKAAFLGIEHQSSIRLLYGKRASSQSSRRFESQSVCLYLGFR